MLELICSQFFKRYFEGGGEGYYIWASNMVNIYKRFSFYSDNFPIQHLYLIILKSKTNQCTLTKYVQTLKYVRSL